MMRICRVCNTEKGNLRLSETWKTFSHEKTLLSRCFFEITGISITSNVDWICEKCVEELVSSYKFRLKAIEGQTKLLEKTDLVLEKVLEESFECAHCSQNFKYKRSLRSHLQKNHFKHLLQHLCPICGARFVFKHELSLHNSQRHKQEKNYSCNICNRLFMYNTSLTVHLTTHSQDRKFTCKYLCGAAFKSRGALFNHERRHQEVIEDAFECPLCGQKFNQKLYYEKHLMVTHSNERKYRCEACMKEFKVKRAFEQHLRVHSGDLFQCEKCEKSYTSKDKLKYHMTCSHGAERRFGCLLCEATFFSNNKLNRHLRNVHKSHDTIDTRKFKKFARIVE